MNTPTPTVHDLAARLTRERTRAVALVNKLENIGVKPSKRLAAAREAQAAHSRLLADKRRDAATVEHEITEAAATANGDALTDALARRQSLAGAVDALNSPAVVERLVQAEVSAAYGAAHDAREDVAAYFNRAAEEFVDVHRKHFSAGPLLAHHVLGTTAADHWGELVDTAERMTLAATVLDIVDGVEDEAPAWRYGRNLLHPAAADRRRIVGGPSMLRADGDLVRVGENITPFASGWEWLGSPEVAPLRPWIDLATADARPGERVAIAYDPAAERADADAFAAMAADHGNVQSSQYDVGTRAGYAAAWWEARQR
ncbi:hypothetical protein [Micrococcus luteus]|uniref:hypothetical protein n=1 Tax=Micrococcus luteus TaxID=1270 RepID=UPI00097EF00A|nr:hypothetical protein [Micrococcus luteus]SJN39098.1 hypothetical protein FM117_10630 [Micrococcus luteus Mu201]